MSCNSWQPWTTAMGQVTQNETRWFDAEGLASIKVQVVASNLTQGDKLFIETTDTPNGTWLQCLTLAPVNSTDPSVSVARTLIRELPDNNPAKLRRYLSERSKILPRRMTGTCAMHQRQLTEAIKRARQIALLPFITD